VREREAGPMPSETMRMRFFLGGWSIVVRRARATMRMRVQRRVRKKGRMERREVRRRNQCLCCVEEEEEKVEEVSDRSSSSSSSRDVERGILGRNASFDQIVINK
jgi:hypothetical protein